MSAESTGLSARFDHWHLMFRRWRWGRPFWAGLLTVLSGLPIVYVPYANLTFGQLAVRIGTTTGSASLIIGVLLFVLGLTMWYQPAVRIFAGVATILLALVSLVVSNFGGIVVGYLLALFGGALSVAWAPGTPATDGPGEKAELPDGAPQSDGGKTGPDLEPYGWDEPVHAGVRPEEETTEENGRNRAG